MASAPVQNFKVGTDEGSSRRDLLQGLVPVTNTHTAHTKGQVSVISKRLVAGTSRLKCLHEGTGRGDS